MANPDLNEVTRTLAAQAMNRRYARPVEEHVSLGAGFRVVVFLAIFGLFTLLAALIDLMYVPLVAPLAALPAFWASRIPRVAAQWERAMVLRLGRFHAMSGPGLIFVFPIVDTVRFIDMRVLTLDIPHQQVITRDNVPVKVDGVIFFRVEDPERAVVSVQDFRYAISNYAQASLRDVIGSMSLDELLSERDQIQARIGEVVEAHTRTWGIHVDSIRLLDIDMPEDLKKMMSRQASAEREKRATITKAEGDKEAAFNLAEAARTMTASPGAMQLRSLQSLDGLGSSPSNTVVLTVPVDIIEAINAFKSVREGAHRGAGEGTDKT